MHFYQKAMLFQYSLCCFNLPHVHFQVLRRGTVLSNETSVTESMLISWYNTLCNQWYSYLSMTNPRAKLPFELYMWTTNLSGLLFWYMIFEIWNVKFSLAMVGKAHYCRVVILLFTKCITAAQNGNRVGFILSIRCNIFCSGEKFGINR